MFRPRLPVAFTLLVLAALLPPVAACGGEPVGRICDLGVEPGLDQTIVASPSLDCTTRTCLRVPLENPSLPEGSQYPTGNTGLCTAECEADEDCERVAESPCAGGFTCAVATEVGLFCCKKFCVCRDYLASDPVVPESCDPTNPANDCINLEGRQP